MNKPEYSDLYKFMASLGLILIAFAILLPWLFLRESFDSLISASEISNLTSTAQTLIAYRQNTALWFVKNIIWISLIPAIAGLMSLISGLFLWKGKQKLVDEKDFWETEKLKLEVKKMSPEQIAIKAIKEASEEIQATKVENESIPEIYSQVRAINKYFQTENVVIEKLANCFGSANVRPHLKVGNTEIDVLVRINKKERVIFEIKSIRKVNVAQRQKDVIDGLLRAVKNYNTIATERTAYGIGLLIINDEDIEKPSTEISAKITNQVIDDIYIKVISITEQEFVNLEYGKLQTMLAKH